MFKNLKKKLEQGVAQSKAAVSGLTKGDESGERNASSEFMGKPLAESTPQKNADQVTSMAQNANTPVTPGSRNKHDVSVPVGQLVDIPLFEGVDSTQYETASDMSSIRGDETPKGPRSRTSSISSMTSDNSFFPSVSFSHSYYVPSDAESELDESSVNLSAVSKEDLYAFVKRFERRAFKYKSKFMELAAAYKDMMQEREKLKLTMAQCQDRAFRRMSELREQIQLDQLAKRDLEDNYRLLLDEKDEYMKVLQMQIKLLKDGKEIPDELQAKLLSKQAKAEASPPTASGDSKANISTNEEIELLKSKIKRQDGLLQKCKETITSYKEKVSQLLLDKQELLGKLELKSGERVNSQTPDETSKLQAQIQEARKVIQQLESDREVAVAGIKQQIHEELARKDAELEQIKGQHQRLVAENNSLKLEVEKLATEAEDLSRTNKEQLEKARSIMKQLKHDKQAALEQAEARIKQAEQDMEDEKEKMISDLKRGKAEAFSVMQQELEKNMAEKVQMALEERDKIWNIKMAEHEEAHSELLQSKDKEKEMALALLQEEIRQKLKEKEEEVRHTQEQRQQQKLADTSGLNKEKDELIQQIQDLMSEKEELNNRLTELQELANHAAELREMLKEKEQEHNRLIEELKADYETRLVGEKSSLSETTAQEIDLVKQRHAEEIQDLLEKQEQRLQESNAQTESYYKTQMENVKERLEGLLSVTKDELEKMRHSCSQVHAKLADTEQQLATAQSELDRRTKEQESQLEELYAAINGRGEENEGLKRILEEIQALLGDRQKELEEVTLKLQQSQEETSRLREQVEMSQGESKTKLEELFTEREDLIQRNQILAAKEESANVQLKALQESNLEFQNQSQILYEELSTLRGEFSTSQNELRALQTEKCKVEEEFQQRLIYCEQERGKLHSETVLLEEQGKFLSDERDHSFREAEACKTKLEELQKHLEEVQLGRETIETKALELESQVHQLQELIRTLESQKTTVEMDKASLEEQVSNCAEVIAALKASKEELNERLNVQHEAHQQYTAEQQTQEVRINGLTSQVDSLQEQVELLNQTMLSKNDENVALKSVIDDSDSLVKLLEARVEELLADIQCRSQEDDSNRSVLAESLKKFERLKNETDVEVRDLRGLIDSLTQKLNEKDRECQDIENTFVTVKDSLINNHNDQMNALREEMNILEQHLKLQIDEKQAEFKERVAKIREDYENKLQEKDTEYADRMKDLLSQKELGIEDLSQNFERLKEEQLRSQEQKYIAALEETENDWKIKYQTLSDEHSQNVDALQSKHQQEVLNWQHRLDSLTQELTSVRNDFASAQSVFEIDCDKYRSNIKDMMEQLAGKDAELQNLMGTLESLHKQITLESDHNRSLTSQVESLTEQLHEKDTKLELIANNMSTEQEHIHQLLKQQIEVTEELQAEKNSVSEQLKEVIEKYREETQEKENLANQIESLTEQLKEMVEKYREETQEKENLANQIESLTEQLKEMEEKYREETQEKENLANQIESLTEQLKEMEEKYREETQEKENLANQIESLTEQLKEMEEKYREETQEKENLANQIQSLTKQLHETENILESLTSSLSTEQEVFQKKLAEQTQIAEELLAQKNNISKQLEEVVHQHQAHKQEKDAVLNDTYQRLQLLEVEHASIEDMLRVIETSSNGDIVEGSLREHIERHIAEKDAQMHILESKIQTQGQQITTLQEELQSLKGYHENILAELKDNHTKELDLLRSTHDSQLEQLTSSQADVQSKAHELETELTQTSEKLQETIENYESRLQEERAKLDRQEVSLKEQISVLKQQLHEVQCQAEVSSSELQSSLQQKVNDGEEKLLKQLQSHQEEMEALRQETEQKMRDLKQKYLAKLKDIQSQAKNTAGELEKQLQTEKASKDDIYAELTKANTQIHQLEVEIEVSRQTVTDLEREVVEMRTKTEVKDTELVKLKTDLAESEKNFQIILQEAQINCGQINDKLTETESRLREKEANLHHLDKQLQEALLLLDQKNSEVQDLSKQYQNLEEVHVQETEKYELEVQEKNRKCGELQDSLENVGKHLEEAKQNHIELDDKVQYLSLELERVKAEKEHLQVQLSQLLAEKKEEESHLLDSKVLLESNLEEQASILKELESKLAEEISQKEQIKEESETKLREAQQTYMAELAENRLLNDQNKEDYESKLAELKQTHAAELAEMSASIEAQSNSKVAEYKRKAEAYISQVKKQLQDENTRASEKQQEQITRLEATISMLTNEIDDFKKSKESFIAENNTEIQEMKSEFDKEMKLKQTVIEEFYQKEEAFHKSESNLKVEIDSLILEKNALLEKLSAIEKAGGDLKVQYIAENEMLKSKNESLQKDLDSMKSDKDEQLAALEQKLVETVQKLHKEHQAALEEQVNDQTSKVKMLVKEMNSQLAVKEREFESALKEALEKSDRSELDLTREHQDDLKELRKEITERDERIEELHIEYKAKIQELMQQNQSAPTVAQTRAHGDNSLLQQQSVSPTEQTDHVNEQNNTELTEVISSQYKEQTFTSATSHQTLDASDPNLLLEMQDLELHNIDLQAQVSHLNGELSQLKMRERDLLKKVEKLQQVGKGISEEEGPTAAMRDLYLNHADSVIFREPTEFEYLKNILYEYMMGKETRTLAKVIATVVRFSDEQTRNVLARTDTKLM
ncbi:hypothetical protein BsWGS_01275 [Bradybaena similaris]